MQLSFICTSPGGVVAGVYEVPANVPPLAFFLSSSSPQTGFVRIHVTAHGESKSHLIDFVRSRDLVHVDLHGHEIGKNDREEDIKFQVQNGLVLAALGFTVVGCYIYMPTVLLILLRPVQLSQIIGGIHQRMVAHPPRSHSGPLKGLVNSWNVTEI